MRIDVGRLTEEESKELLEELLIVTKDEDVMDVLDRSLSDTIKGELAEHWKDKE